MDRTRQLGRKAVVRFHRDGQGPLEDDEHEFEDKLDR